MIEEELETTIEKYLKGEGWEVLRQVPTEKDKNKIPKYRKRADLIIRHQDLWEQGLFPYWIGLELKVNRLNNTFSNIAKGIPQIVKKYQNQKFMNIEQRVGPWVLITDDNLVHGSKSLYFEGLNRVAIQFGIGTFKWNKFTTKKTQYKNNYNRFNFNPSNNDLSIPFERDNLFEFDSNRLTKLLKSKGVLV